MFGKKIETKNTIEDLDSPLPTWEISPTPVPTAPTPPSKAGLQPAAAMNTGRYSSYTNRDMVAEIATTYVDPHTQLKNEMRLEEINRTHLGEKRSPK